MLTKFWRSILLVTALAFFALPQAGKAIQFDPNQTNTNPQSFGQEHAYNVLFRNNGEAVVSGEIKVTNNGKDNIVALSYKSDRLILRSLKIWQYVNYRQCFSSTDNSRASDTMCEPLYNTGMVSGYGYYFTSGQDWKELTSNIVDGKLVISLLDSIRPGQEGRLQIRYRGFGYVKQGWFGRRNFDFESLSSADEIKKVDVNISVDTDIFFQGKKSDIAFKEEVFATAPKIMASKAGSAEMNQLGLSAAAYTGMSAGGYTGYGSRNYVSMSKSAQYLSPDEVFHVKGMYASSWWGLYYSRVLGLILLLIAIIAGIIFGVRFWRARFPKSDAVQFSSGAASIPAAGQVVAGKLVSKWWHDTLAGLGGSLIFLLFVYLILWLGKNMPTYGRSEFFEIIFAIVSFIVGASSLLAMSVYTGHRYGRKSGLVTFLFQVLFLFVFMILYVLWGQMTSSY